MSTPLAIVLILVAIPAMVAVPALTYYALSKVLQGIPRGRPRRHIMFQSVGFSVGAVLLAVLIIAPWGAHDTVLFVIGGLCLIVFVALGIVVAQGVVRSRRTS